MSEKACWERFLATGRVEDYLQFKAVKKDTKERKETAKENGLERVSHDRREFF